MRTARASEDMGVGRGAARPDAHESLAKVAIVAQKSMRGDRIRQGGINRYATFVHPLFQGGVGIRGGCSPRGRGTTEGARGFQEFSSAFPRVRTPKHP